MESNERLQSIVKFPFDAIDFDQEQGNLHILKCTYWSPNEKEFSVVIPAQKQQGQRENMPINVECKTHVILKNRFESSIVYKTLWTFIPQIYKLSIRRI